jgi:hypothetical protein
MLRCPAVYEFRLAIGQNAGYATSVFSLWLPVSSSAPARALHAPT